MRLRRWGSLLVPTAMAALGVASACGTDAVGVDACRKIEEARCERAPDCRIVLVPPYHTSGTDVDACRRFYDDACLHGLASSDPGTTATNACVGAIDQGGCDVVAHPESDPACAWLGAESGDAGAGADAAGADAAGAD
ncbi:MAG: hypothetical protein JOZ69_20170 [Myxococcales bacterium]|nr:hypothetical protein [Myxococcales bacterium]